MITGDWNDDQKEGDVNTTELLLREQTQARTVTTGAPTRWDSQRCIDYTVTNMPDTALKDIKETKHKLSDHKLLKMQVRLPQKTDRQMVKVQQKPTFLKPAGLEKQSWTQRIETNYQKQEMKGKEFDDLMKRKTVDVEEEWMMWNTILEEAFRQTVEQQLNDQEGREEEMDTKYTLEEEKKMKRAIKTKVHKRNKAKASRKTCDARTP